MKTKSCFLGLLFMSTLYAQQKDLAQNYFEQAQYGKALSIYEKLFEENPTNSGYLFQRVAINQDLVNYLDA